MINYENEDQHALMEWIDPDWRDHFMDTAQALDFYLAGEPDHAVEKLIKLSAARHEGE